MQHDGSADCNAPVLARVQAIVHDSTDHALVLCRGMPGNAAPEVLKGKAWWRSPAQVDGRKADVFAYGKTLMTMVLLQESRPGKSFSQELGTFKVRVCGQAIV